MILGPESSSSVGSLSSMSTNPAGFGQFSNNNYMPGIGNPCVTQFVPSTFLNSSSISTGTTNTVSCSSAVSSSVLTPPGASSSLFLNYGGLPLAQHIQTGFTFTSPTQSYSLMGSPPGTMLPGGVVGPHHQHLHHLHHHHHPHTGGGNSYLQTSTATTPSTAPGVGVTWQHTVPSSMPWVQTNSITPNPVCFSDVMSSSSIIMGNDPKPSCSCSPRRPKRRGTDMYEETDMFQIPPNKVCLSEEKVAQQLQELSIDPNSYSCLSRSTSCDMLSKDQAIEHTSHWRRTLRAKEIKSDKESHEMEERSDILTAKNIISRKIIQEIINEDENSENKTQRSLHIVEDLTKDILVPKNVLPRKIIQEIIATPIPKPCLDVVLWHPPDVLANVVKSSSEETFTNSSMTRDQPTRRDLPKSALNFPDISLLPYTSTQAASQVYEEVSFTAEDDEVMDI